jgi:steroid delta-isomerase
MIPLPKDPRTAAVVVYYQALTPASLDQLAHVYANDAAFKDPFNQVQGLAAIRHIFQKMFDKLDSPRFTVLNTLTDGDQAMLVWDFTFSKKGLPSPMCIHGSSHLRFDTTGKVVWHRDYWDAAEELYSKLPVIGALMRWLQRQLA